MFNYVHENVDDRKLPRVIDENLDIFMSRFQIVFWTFLDDRLWKGSNTKILVADIEERKIKSWKQAKEK